MKIGGFQKTTLLDYPGHVAAIIWTVGCNFRCPFCYNTELVEEKSELFSEEEILVFLEKRKDFLEGLVISGGEPFLQTDLKEFCKKVKKLGYKIKIDTNGTFPEKLKEFIDEKLVDYLSMDIKAPEDKYSKLSGKKVDTKKIQESIEVIKSSDVEYEFKTTFVPEMLVKKDINSIGKWLNGSDKFYLQQFKNDIPTLSSELVNLQTYSEEELIDALETVKPFFKHCDIRGT